MTTVTIFLDKTSTSPWTVPSDWNSANNTIEVLGAGGGTADDTTAGIGPLGGAGGGAYSKKNNASLTPGASVAFVVGLGGSHVYTGVANSANGGDTWFGNAVYGSAIVAAKGGQGIDDVTITSGALGGAAASGIGDVTHSGGAGETVSAGNGGGGGGAAGPNGNGNNGAATAGGSGDAGLGGAGGLAGATGGSGTEFDASHGSGGGGGGGTNTSRPGHAGGNYGAGAGGPQVIKAGASGTDGLIKITYTALTAINYNQTINITSISTLSSLRLTRKTVAVGVSTTTSMSRLVGKIISVTEATLFTLVSRLVNKTITISETTVLSSSRSASKSTSVISATSSLTTSRVVGKGIVVTPIASLVTLLKSMGIRPSIAVTSTLAIVRQIARQLGITVVSSLLVTALRNIVRTLVIVSTTTLTVGLSIGKTASLVIRSVILEPLKFITKSVPMTAVTSVLVLFARGALAVRDIIGRSVKNYIIGRSDSHVISRATEPVTITGSALMTIHDPIDVECGDSWLFEGPQQDADGAPLNLTGASITWKLDTPDGLANLLTLTLGSGITITDAPTSTIRVNATPEQTRAISAGTYRDWLHVTLADGSVLTQWSGIIRAAPAPA